MMATGTYGSHSKYDVDHEITDALEMLDNVVKSINDDGDIYNKGLILKAMINHTLDKL